MRAVPGVTAQLAALLRLRLAMLGGRRRAVRASLTWIPIGVVALVAASTRLPAGNARDILLLLPTAWLLFAATAVVAAVTGATGRELLPREHSAVFPVDPAADHAGALLLTPLNLAWSLQLVGLLVATSWAVGPRPGLVAAQVSVLVWVVAVTCVAQALGWAAELARSSRTGAWLLRGLAVAAVVTVVVVLSRGDVVTVLQRSPTVTLVADAQAGATGTLVPWSRGVATTGLVAVVAWALGVRLLRSVQRRPSLVRAHVESRRHARRGPARTELRAYLRIDRASVWRSVPLRRGLAALVALPALAAGLARLDWTLVALLPGVVASGAGLLFGVNAFSLDGSGAVWRDTLPGTARLVLLARALVIGELCAAAAVLTVLGAALRAPGSPSATQVVALLCAVAAATAQVTSRCLVWSLDHPYAAALREARDQPAPPAAMAGYSVRLATVTTATGLTLAALSAGDAATAMLVFTLAVLLLAARRGLAATRGWQDAVVRSRVVGTVAGVRA